MKNWKTTLLGITAALAMVWSGAVQNKQLNNTPITAGTLVPAITVAVLGAVAKDHNK